MTDTQKLKMLTNKFLERLDIIKEQVNHVQEAVNDKMLMENDSIQQIISEAVDFSQLQDSLRTEYTKLFPDECCSPRKIRKTQKCGITRN